jgi:hypothetical protein
MPLEPLEILHTGVFLAVVAGVYGWLVGALWAPFLLSGRLRGLFDALSSREWWVNYVLAIPLPAVLWGFLFGTGLSTSRDVLDPGGAAPLYAAGVDGVVFATAVSLLLWPAILLSGLPDRGLDWADGRYDRRTGALTVIGVCWYHLFLAVPGYVLSIAAGFGQVLSHSA